MPRFDLTAAHPASFQINILRGGQKADVQIAASLRAGSISKQPAVRGATAACTVGR